MGSDLPWLAMRSPTTPSNGAFTSASPRFLWAISSWASATDHHRGLVLGGGAGGVERRLRDDVALGQRLLVAEVARRPACVGAGGVEGRLALVDPGLQLVGLEARQHLALGDAIALRAPAPRPAVRRRAPFTIVWSMGWVVPVKRTTSTRPRGLMVCSSAAISSIGRSPGLVDVATAAALPEPLPFFQAKAPPASTTTPATMSEQQLALGGHGRSPFRTKSI